MERSASGRRGVEADEARAGEVRPLHSSIEADEQTWATGGGVGGAKGEDRGKHGRATHVPDTAPDKRVSRFVGRAEWVILRAEAYDQHVGPNCPIAGQGRPVSLG